MSSLRSHLRDIALLPGIVTLVIPTILVLALDETSVGWRLGAPLALIPITIGLVLIGAGLAMWARTVLLFARHGEGTLAPWEPTQKLVVLGPYRYVRNPMITAVISILFGEAILLGSLAVFVWAALFLALNATFIPLAEERWLEDRFGAQYREYKKNVPRWIPRTTPWEPPGA